MLFNRNTEKDRSSQQPLLTLYHNSRFLSHEAADRYMELNLFRRQIEVALNGPHHEPYQAMQKKANMYRLIFLGLSLLFLALGLLIYQHSINWTSYVVIFSNFQTAKIVMCTICLLLSGASFVVSWSIRPEKEASHQLIRRAKNKLARAYTRHQTESPFSTGENRKRYNALKHTYHRALDKISESKEATWLLFEHIRKARSIASEERVKLYNQAILELNDSLHAIINRFQNNFQS